MKKILPILLISALCACSTRSGDGEKTEFPDSLFLVEKLTKAKQNPEAPQMNFKELSQQQKMELAVPIMAKEMKVDSNYVLEFMQSRFISKEKTPNGYTVINLRINGDDYDATFYVVLNEDNKMISHFRLSGGFCAGPNEMTSNYMIMCTERYSVLNDDKIWTYDIKEKLFTGTPQRPSVIDSISYESSVDLKGQIKTVKLDSVRFTRDVKDK